MKRKSGQTLIASMIVIVIILILIVVFFGVNNKSPRKDKLGATTPGLARLAAKDEVCRNNLSQLRSALEIAHSGNGDEAYSATLEETKLGREFYYCPIGGERYVYDPATGRVHCPHPGHENF